MTSFAKSRIARLLCLSLAAQLFATSVAATPAQVPLTSSFGTRPKPNFMLTLDTSGSMDLRHMPEGTFTVNGYGMVFGSGVLSLHPADLDGNGTTSTPTAAPPMTMRAVDMAMRSPDVNTIYYNPAVYYKPWARAGGGRFPDASFTAALVNPLDASKGAINFSDTDTDYCWRRDSRGQCTLVLDNGNAAVYYRLRANSDPNVTGSYTLVNLRDAAPNTTFNKAAARQDCLAARCTLAEERRNFANWFVYYRTRMLLTKAALSEVFSSIGNVARVGWTTLAYAADPQRSSAVIQPLRELTDTHKQRLVNAVQGFVPSGSTPLRAALYRVGTYFQTDAPWYNNPDRASDGSSACRRAFNLLTTDGYYNDHELLSERPSWKVYDVDAQYSAAGRSAPASRPYQDTADNRNTYSNTLADYALHFWRTDLNTNVSNGLRPINGGNPATWQHLSQFTVSIGLKGELDPTVPTTLEDLRAGRIAWPNPNPYGSDRANANASVAARIDDLWHAAVNSHGAFYSADNADQLVGALRDALGKAGDAELREAGVATTLPSVSSGNRIYVPQYLQGSWVGDIQAFSLNANGTRSSTPTWRASQSLPGPNERSLFIRDGNSTVPFTTSGVSATTKSAMGVTIGTADDLIQYLRGVTTREGSGADRYRERERTSPGSAIPALPDFVDSNLLVAKGHVDLGYGDLPSGGSSYADFLARKANRSPVLFIGGNGGFLHAFSDAANGREIFGYVPAGAIPHLKLLTDRDYGLSGLGKEHRFFVNGPLVESDAYFTRGSSTEWRSVLVGAMGAGGKGLFALHLDTNDVAGNLNANSVLWDLTASNDADMGHIFADAQVGVLPDGSWKVFVGNGYGSTNGAAVLYMIDVATGSVTKLSTGSTGSNGLGGVALVRNSLRQVVAAYAGDLRGQVWRFEWSESARRMTVGYGGSPLFTATAPDGSRQPVTAVPLVVSHPSGGQLVLVGTGKLIEEADRDNAAAATQSIYGIRDVMATDVSTASRESSFNGPTVDRTLLAERRIRSLGTTTRGGITTEWYTVEANGSLGAGAENLGWRLDLTLARGQRIIYPLRSLSSLLIASSIVPAAASGECETGSGSGATFVLDAVTGLALDVAVIDTNGDGVVNNGDSTASGFSTIADGRDALLVPPSGGEGPAQLCDTQDCKTIKAPPPQPTTRVIRDRVWKRLINVPMP